MESIMKTYENISKRRKHILKVKAKSGLTRNDKKYIYIYILKELSCYFRIKADFTKALIKYKIHSTYSN